MDISDFNRAYNLAVFIYVMRLNVRIKKGNLQKDDIEHDLWKLNYVSNRRKLDGAYRRRQWNTCFSKNSYKLKTRKSTNNNAKTDFVSSIDDNFKVSQ